MRNIITWLLTTSFQCHNMPHYLLFFGPPITALYIHFQSISSASLVKEQLSFSLETSDVVWARTVLLNSAILIFCFIFRIIFSFAEITKFISISLSTQCSNSCIFSILANLDRAYNLVSVNCQLPLISSDGSSSTLYSIIERFDFSRLCHHFVDY